MTRALSDLTLAQLASVRYITERAEKFEDGYCSWAELIHPAANEDERPTYEPVGNECLSPDPVLAMMKAHVAVTAAEDEALTVAAKGGRR
jgi:hypothetical protein